MKIAIAATAYILMVGGLLHVLLHQVNHQIATQAVVKAPFSSPSLQIISPAPTPAAPSPSESATTPASKVTATPSATTPATTSESATTPSATAPATTSESATTPAPEITDAAKLAELNQKVYAQIDANWQTTPTFTENLVYRVKVNQSGAIASYESANKSASEYLQETPFASLAKSASSETAKESQEPMAHFQVVLTPAGEIQIAPVKNPQS